MQVPCKFQINRFINNRAVDDPNTRAVDDQGTRADDIPSIRAVDDPITRAVNDPGTRAVDDRLEVDDRGGGAKKGRDSCPSRKSVKIALAGSAIFRYSYIALYSTILSC